MLRSAYRAAGTLTATAILLFALFVAVTGAFSTRAEIRASFDRQRALQSAQLALEELLRVQIDEETAVRGYAITRDSTFLDPYYAAVTRYAPLEAQVKNEVRQEQLTTGLEALVDFEKVHEDWHRDVAEPLIRNPGGVNAVALQKRGKGLIDQERYDATALQTMLAQRNLLVGDQTQDEINQTLYVRAAWLIIFGLLAILFNAYRARLDRELVVERATTETLQRAFESEVEPLPNCEIGTKYISASRNAAVGGDVFDLYRLSDNLALMVIADVSGKGVDAAVLTAFIKFTIRGIALRRRDPAAILAEFNTAFPRAVPNPYIFVSMFVGMLNFVENSLAYASGGHDSAWIRRSDGTVQQLSVTGPILGVMEEPFATRMVALAAGDTIVLSTDGLTEARDKQGRQLGEEAMRYIADSGTHARQIVDGLIVRLRRRTSNKLNDDVAMLAVTLGVEDAGNA